MFRQPNGYKRETVIWRIYLLCYVLVIQKLLYTDSEKETVKISFCIAKLQAWKRSNQLWRGFSDSVMWVMSPLSSPSSQPNCKYGFPAIVRRKLCLKAENIHLYGLVHWAASHKQMSVAERKTVHHKQLRSTNAELCPNHNLQNSKLLTPTRMNIYKRPLRFFISCYGYLVRNQ